MDMLNILVAIFTIVSGIISIISFYRGIEKDSPGKKLGQKDSIFVPEHYRRRQEPAKPQRKPLFVLATVSIIVCIVSGTFWFIIRYPQNSASGKNSFLATTTSSSTTNTIPTNTTTMPYPPYKGVLEVNDSLTDNQGNVWDEVINPNYGFCKFVAGAYHAEVSQPQQFFRCSIESSNYSNFAFEVKMTLIRGDQAGIVFRADDTNGSLYYFIIGADGTYDFDIIQNHNFVKTVVDGKSLAISPTSIQANFITVGVVAQQDHFDFYVNQKPIAHAMDKTFSAGQVGVVAFDSTNPTEAAFSDLKVWTF